MRVAALYVEKGGIYSNQEEVECWDEKRDARTCSGDLPVVAHPPCQLWVNLTGVNYNRYGGVHNRPGNDGGCFALALQNLRRCGGVLEHPAGSYAWNTFALEKPSPRGVWTRVSEGEWTCEVWQSAYGHPARKRTWLYYVGEIEPFEMNWSQEAGTHQVGWFDRKKPTLSKKAAIATPPAFAQVLINLARHARAGERK